MGPTISRWLVDSAREVARLVSRGAGLGAIYERMREIARRDIPYCNVREVAVLARGATDLARRARRYGTDDEHEIASRISDAREIRGLEKVANAMDRRLQAKAKRALLARELDKPCVFYAITTHQKPRCAHRALQGTVAYDRSYRRKLTEAGNWQAVRECEKFIRKHGLKSVQELVGEPYYVTTAPYCRHRFVALDTREVLAGVANTVIRDGAHRSKTDAQRYAEYKNRRKEIASGKRALR